MSATSVAQMNAFLQAYRRLRRPAQQAPNFAPKGNFKRLLDAIHAPLSSARSAGSFADPWQVAGLGENEVRNTAVLAWWLDPRGSHGLGARYLEAFLHLGLGDHSALRSDLARARVMPEHRPQGSGRDRVDVVIDLPDTIVFVEAKINAAEGEAQLPRYAEAARAMGKTCAPLIFLAPRSSRQTAVDHRHISWRQAARVLRRIAPPGGASRLLALQFARHIRQFG